MEHKTLAYSLANFDDVVLFLLIINVALAFMTCFAFYRICYHKDSRSWQLDSMFSIRLQSLPTSFAFVLDFCCKLFYQTAKTITNVANSVFMQINHLVFDPEMFAKFQIAR